MHIVKSIAVIAAAAIGVWNNALAEPHVDVWLNDAPLINGAVIERIDDVLITTTNSEGATLAGQLSARDTDQLDMSKIALPILDPVYIGITAGQEHFRVTEDNCTTRQLAPGTAVGSSCDVTLTPRATKPGFFTGKLQVKAGSYETEIPLSGQARNFCAPEPAIMMTSSCSQPCGGGTQTTTYTDGCGATWTDTAACNTQACDAYNWNSSQFGNCSEVCDGGIQFRDVWCERFSDGARVADNFCQDDLKPAGSAQCNTMTCYRDYKVCGWIPDIPVELAYRGYRLQVVDEDNPDSYRYVSSTCEPDANESTLIDDRVAGCEAVHHDYPNDEISYGAVKWYVTETDEPLTQCLESTDIVYPWTLVAAGWDEHDDDLEAYRERNFQIDVNGQIIPVTDPMVHEGEEAVAYELQGTETLPTGENYQEVCVTYERTIIEETWLRPAGTDYVRENGAGEPIYVAGNDLHMEDGQCLPNTKSVPIANGSQDQEWNGEEWEVTNVHCNSSYVRSGNQCVYRWSGSWSFIEDYAWSPGYPVVSSASGTCYNQGQTVQVNRWVGGDVSQTMYYVYKCK